MPLDRRRLRVEFSTESTFRSEYLSNISNGGVFIATSEAIDVRALVVVSLELSWCGEVVELEGEVVHRIGDDMAETGATPGVAIQFDLPAKELRGRFEGLVGSLDGNERVTKSGRRAAPRSPARVSVRLGLGDGRTITCRTRDVSTTGLLVSLHDESPVPIGDELDVTLGHPAGKEEMQVEGLVARHLVTDDGVVTAMGIHLKPPPARATEVTAFMNDIRAAEHRRRLDGITGPIEDLGIENLLQMFGASSPRGTLTVTRGAEEGIVVFDGGRLHTVRLGRETGMDAMREMLVWREGSFEFRARIDPADLEGSGMDVPLNAALLDALCAVDERRRDERGAEGKTAAAGKTAVARPRSAAGKTAAARPRGDAGERERGDPADGDLEIEVDLDVDVDVDVDVDLDLDSAMREFEDDVADRSSGSRAREGASRRKADAKPKGDAGRSRRARRSPEPKPSGRTKRRAGKGKAPAERAVAKPAAPRAAAPMRIDEATRFRVDTGLADAMRSELGKTEQAVLDLALVGMGVERMVEVIPEAELDVYRALDSLLDLGILRI